MRKTITWLMFFSIAMGFLESAVVIYLRKIYYPDGFHFPLRVIEPATGLVEILREAATLIMLVAVGITAGKTKTQRFAFFLLCFGTWDIFYYVFLKLFLDWPSSIFEPDILFLIPVPWVGPVLAPLVLSTLMIALSLKYILQEHQLRDKIFRPGQIVLLISGSVIVILSFIIHSDTFIINPNDQHNTTDTPFPGFNWLLFGTGILCFILSVTSMTGLRFRKEK